MANAVAAGELSLEAGLIYEVFAAFGDSRLPQEFQAPSTAGGTSTLAKVRESFDTLSEEARATLEPFLLPPSAPGSWHELPTAAANVTEKAREPGIGAKASALSIEWTKVTAVAGKVTIWSEDRYAGEDALAREIASELDGNIWPKIFGELGMKAPVSDAGLPNNGGDESLDLYLVHLGANADNGLATARSAACASGPTSVYLTLNTQSARARLLPVVAHEVMHAAQFAYARTDCKSHWWEEATATWVEDVSYPNLNAEQVYAPSFLNTPEASLESEESGSTRSYGAYLLPFMLDRKYMARTFVRRTFELIERFTTLRAIQAALTEVTPGGFREVWPEFAKYNWNQKPVVDYEDWDGVIAQPQHSERIRVYAGVEGTPVNTAVKHLATRYVRVSVSDPDVRKLRIDNLIVGDNVRGGHVWLIPRIGGDWQQPEVLSSEKAYCRDKAEENVEEMILVISNSEQDEAYQLPDESIHLSGLIACPKSWNGTFTSTIVSFFDGIGLTQTEVASANVNFEFDPAGYYVASAGTVSARFDMVSSECERTYSFAGPVNAGDGAFYFEGDGPYDGSPDAYGLRNHGEGATGAYFVGTLACAGMTRPDTTLHVANWWPSPEMAAEGYFSIHPDGHLEEMFEETYEDGYVHRVTTAHWSLVPTN